MNKLLKRTDDVEDSLYWRQAVENLLKREGGGLDNLLELPLPVLGGNLR